MRLCSVFSKLLFGALLTSTGAAKAQSPSSVDPPPPIPSSSQILYAPIAGIEGFNDWQVAVVNRSARDIPATIVLYSPEGKAYPPTLITLKGDETQNLDIKDLAPAEMSGHTLGGMAIQFFGTSMAIGAQITLSSFHGFGNLDAVVFSDMMFKSNTSNAVWWEPEGSRSYLILGNSSEQKIHAQVSYDNGSRREFDLAPHATRIEPVVNDTEGAGTRDEGYESSKQAIRTVHVTGDGMPGTLRALGYAASSRSGFLNTIRFSDPAESTEPVVYANGLHFSNSSNHLVVQNLTSNLITINGTIFPTAKTTSMISLPEKLLAGGASSELEIPSTEGLEALDGAAVKIESSGGPGSFTASYVSHDPANRITRAAPFKDLGDLSLSTGGYPWRLDGSFHPVVYITNVGKVRAAIGGSIVSRGAPDYQIDTHYLEVGETAVFDLRRIRDEQTPDPNGVTLSKDAQVGQFHWSTIFGDGSQRFIGRNEVLDESSGTSASFSCPYCNCPFSTSSAWISPGAPVVVINGVAVVIATAQDTDSCNSGKPPSNFTIYPSSWSISQPGYFTVTPNQSTSNMTGTASGGSYFYTPFDGVIYMFNGNSCFVQSQPQLNPGGTGDSCDFTITPGGITNADCTGKQNSVTYAAQVTPSLSSCAFQPSQSTCSFTVSGTIESGTNTNNMTAMSPSCTGTYFAGPGASGSEIGHITFSMSLRLGQSTVSHTNTVEVDCK